MNWKWLSFLALPAIQTASAFVMPASSSSSSVVGTTTTKIAIRPPPPASSSTRLHGAAAAASTVNSMKSVRNLAVAGRIPWKKLILTKAQGLKVLSIMRAETHPLDVAIVFILSVFPERIGRFVYDKFLHRLRDNVDYDESITCHVLQTLSEASRLTAFCYFFDTIEVAMEITGFKGRKTDVSTLVTKLLFATWACFKGRLYKRSFIETFIDKTASKKAIQGKQGIVEIFDKVSDFFLFSMLSLVYIDILGIKVGKGLSSIFALGGTGTFVLTLASQDLAKRAMNSMALSASDAFYVGDAITLGDGTSGVVTSLGWLNTELRGFDEKIIRIPNSQLSDVRISNVSRVKFSQVKQTLHFRYRDLERIPKLVNTIKEEIAASCPKVILDGSRVFRVRMVEFSRDSVEVLVDCRLRNPPFGEPYYEARQGILEAIARAARKEKVEFAMPTIERLSNS